MTAPDGRLDRAPLASTGAPVASAISALRVDVLESWAGLREIRSEWDALLDHSDSASVFLGSAWIECWTEQFGGAYRPMVMLCRDDSTGALCGIAPLLVMRTGTLQRIRTVRFVGDVNGHSDNLDIVARRGWERRVAEAVLHALDAVHRDWDVIELGQMPAESSVLPHLREGMARRGWDIESRTSPHLVIDLPRSWAEVLAGLSKKARWAATYSDRHLARAGALASVHCTRRSELPRYLDAFFRLHDERWSVRGERGNFRDPARRAFYAQLAERLLDDGQLDFDLLELDGQAIAAQLGCRYGDTAYLLDAGFDTAHARFSPGVVLTARVIRRLIADGIARYDFQEGDEAHKQRWSPRASHYVHMRVAQRGSRGARHLRVTRAAARGRAMLRRLVRRMRSRTTPT